MTVYTLGSRSFSPTKILCVGRNYARHIEEMGGGEAAQRPAVFIKPTGAIAADADNVFVPETFGLLHHEVELCFIVGRTCKGVTVEEAGAAIAGWSVGLDLTLRRWQNEARQKGEPWDMAKGFDNAAVFGPFADAHHIAPPVKNAITLHINGDLRQQGNTGAMLFSPAVVLSFVSTYMTVNEGDIFMTGTPSGVGEILHGDRLVAEVAGLPKLEAVIRRRQPPVSA